MKAEGHNAPLPYECHSFDRDYLISMDIGLIFAVSILSNIFLVYFGKWNTYMYQVSGNHM